MPKLGQKPPPPSASKHDKNELKELRNKGTNPYIYAETLPRNKKIYSWTLEDPGRNPTTTKKFTTKPVTIPPKRNVAITPQPLKQLEKTPKHIDDYLADLSWLPEALNLNNKQDKQINTPVLSCTPSQRVDYYRPAANP